MRANNFPKTLWHEHKAARVSHEELLSSCRLQLNYLPKQLDKSNPQKAGSCQRVENSDKSKTVFISYLKEPGERRDLPGVGRPWEQATETSQGEEWLVSWWERQDFCPEIFLENQIFSWLFPLYFSFQNFSNEMEEEALSLTSHFFTSNGDESEKTIVFNTGKFRRANKARGRF